MSLIKKNEIKAMTNKQREEKITDLKKEIIKSNAQISTGTVPENPGRIKEIRRTIARLITINKINAMEAKKNKV